MPDSIKNLVEIQKKIQNLKADSGNSGILQQLLKEAGYLVRLSDEEAGAKILEYRDELNFYLDDNKDNLERFYRCKAESLTIIAKKI
jgi:hypothetical protein